MNENDVLVISLLVSVLGLIVVSGIVWFGYVIARGSRKSPESMGHPTWGGEMFYEWAKHNPSSSDELPRIAYESYAEYLQRRNEFWTAYGQVLLAVLIVIVLTILLITKTITAEAGLPILSGISGFAIAKGVSAAKSGGFPQLKKPNA